MKSQVGPPVCPACPAVVACPSDNKKCPPCPPCARCPEPAFECKKVPNYSGQNDSYLPHSEMRFLAAVVLIAAHFWNGVQSFVPSMMLHQRQSSLYFSRGDEFGPVVSDINSPDDFKDFVAVDDRPAVIKVYADWCKTCRLFDIRYRKVASSWGCDPNSAIETEFSNLVRFAQMEFGGENCNNCREDLRH